ncbi:pilus assembly PilX family protein [Variovorax ureilyticus]|uniref:pilus assembly PilX family protein n=1 Tax=Variovorax ureilyticus TaxID=1836198 RepID=UPI003D66A227
MNRRMSAAGAQRGAALIVGLIMLVLITLTVVAGFSLSNGNLKAVGNIQVRDEAVAASNRAIEEVLTSLLLPNPDGTPTLATPVATQSSVDINNDGVVDYQCR